MYQKYLKRLFDVVLSFFSLVILSPVFLIIGIAVKIKLGLPIIFEQERVGKDEKVFVLYKFRTMTNKKDINGNLLPDNERLDSFGKFLRETSLDELPELFNILIGDMSIVGPRPLLTRYLKFYTETERKRHSVRPGLTGLAQINGRNFKAWDERFKLDVEYVENINFINDLNIILKTVVKVLKREDVAVRQDIPIKDFDEERKEKIFGGAMQEEYRCYEIIDTTEKEKWNDIVKSFDNWDVFYLADYAKTWELISKDKIFLFYFKDKSIRAINVFCKRDIANDKFFKGKINEDTFFDISTPYGYGGFIVEGGDYQKVNKEFENYCMENKIISEFVRFNLFTNYQDLYYGDVTKLRPNVIRRIDEAPEKLFMKLKNKVRANLRKANENNLSICIDSKGEMLDEFLNVYYKTMDRNNAKKEYYFPREFFESLLMMENGAVIFNVMYEGKVISTELVLHSDKNCYSFLGGTLSEYFPLKPNEFLKYEIIKWAYENKIENFVLGGGYTNELDDGILRYKKGFAPKEPMKDFYIGKKIFNEELYKKLVNLRESEELDERFFPLYRA